MDTRTEMTENYCGITGGGCIDYDNCQCGENWVTEQGEAEKTDECDPE
jgi:hypothetical protein